MFAARCDSSVKGRTRTPWNEYSRPAATARAPRPAVRRPSSGPGARGARVRTGGRTPRVTEPGVSDQYGVRDAACPPSTRGGGLTWNGDLEVDEDTSAVEPHLGAAGRSRAQRGVGGLQLAERAGRRVAEARRRAEEVKVLAGGAGAFNGEFAFNGAFNDRSRRRAQPGQAGPQAGAHGAPAQQGDARQDSRHWAARQRTS
jgi:hypothetical protein